MAPIFLLAGLLATGVPSPGAAFLWTLPNGSNGFETGDLSGWLVH